MTQNPHHTPTRKSNGFTLIELMITVAVIGLLAAVVFPSYQSQVRKSRRADAVQALAQLQQGQERFRANSPVYGATLANAGIVNATTTGGYYTLAITTGSATATGYIATATAVAGGSQAKDTGCTVLTTTVTNGSANNEPPNCWSQ